MPLANCKNARTSLIRGLGLPSCILFSLLCSSAWAQEKGAIQAPIEAPAQTQQGDKSIEQDVDWRDAMLTELATLANALDKQQKFGSILRDKIDILNHRIDQLEQSNDKQAKRITELTEALSEAQIESQAQLARPSSEAVSPKASAPKSPEAKPKAEIVPDKIPETAPNSEEQAPEDFEQFLDMGEAMLRRFFGVVKEFRKEFDDNRV